MTWGPAIVTVDYENAVMTMDDEDREHDKEEDDENSSRPKRSIGSFYILRSFLVAVAPS